MVEPERAGLDRLVVFMAELVFHDGKGKGSGVMVDDPQKRGIGQRRFAVPKGVEDVERDLGGLEEAAETAVTDGNSILQQEISPQSLKDHPPFRKNSIRHDLQAAIERIDHHIRGIRMRDRIDLPFARGERRAGHADEKESFLPGLRGGPVQRSPDFHAQIGDTPLQRRLMMEYMRPLRIRTRLRKSGLVQSKDQR
ncbi:MAG: hypothetical protein AAB229_04810 [Candidatus Hydrogenedentota bacterium]